MDQGRIQGPDGDGFGSLETIGAYVSIYQNPAITEISGFDNLTEVVGDFDINSNNNLETISGFGSLTLVEGNFYIRTNTKLTDASGLWKVVSVGGDFYCYENTQLNAAEFARLVTSLTTIGGDNIAVNNNDAANDFAAPVNLKWGAAGSRPLSRTLNGYPENEEQQESNSFGGAGTPAATIDLFDLPVYAPP